VDRLAKLVRKAGGKALEGTEICVGYSRGYYAFFFEDPEGNKPEICCRERPIIASKIVAAIRVRNPDWFFL
jgi:hypothetical protein